VTALASYWGTTSSLPHLNKREFVTSNDKPRIVAYRTKRAQPNYASSLPTNPHFCRVILPFVKS
jgi:hypothetical protein